VDHGVLAGGGLERRGIDLDLVRIDLAVVQIGDLQRHPRLHAGRHHAHAKLRHERHVEQAEEDRDVLRIGDRVEQHEPRDAPLEPLIGFERQQQRDPAPEGVADQGQVAEILVHDELGEQLGLIEDRIALVERLVRLAETLEVDGDDPMGLGKLGRHVAPRIGARAEAMNEQKRRPLALLLIEELDRSLGRPEPCVGPVERIAGAEPAGPERERNGCKA
jgi:hypothetical protein